MKAGEVISRFTAKKGSRITLRAPTWNDLDALLSLINSLVKEGAEIDRDAEISREAELEWLARTLMSVERDEGFFVVAETTGGVMASSSFRARGGYAKHVADLGIVVKKGYRDIGVGTGSLVHCLSGRVRWDSKCSRLLLLRQTSVRYTFTRKQGSSRWASFQRLFSKTTCT